ncbi:MAG: UDP-N-acetylmuramoyl-tripeptide--D-alanyl-D-alanine ligase [Burkholderiales bacterium]|nr:UDP-N-acetylmuramoyl-tripeptide--D-alanyl-D-alanine ligase [Phycisphaerae bacterium]
MLPLTLREVAAAIDGTLVCGALQAVSESTQIGRVCTDTRQMHPDSLFIALKGETFDAHDHLDDAIAGGAVAAMVDHGAPSIPHVRVANTRLAMGRLANHVRRRFGETKVIAVAGSNGKTGTKHLIHSVLATRLRGTMSPKSFNNDVGVPLTLFDVEPGHDYVIVEIGTNHPGEVRHLSLMCEPDIAIITSIGEEHLEFFKDLHGVRRENADIAAGVRGGGRIFVIGDDSHLRTLLPTTSTFGFDPTNDLVARDVRTTLEGTSFVAGTPFMVPQIGRHNASNALAAIAVGRAMGLSDDDIRTGLASATAPEMRMQKRTIGPVTIINDAYNANPTSVRAALTTLAEIDWPGRKIVVLGEMRELGDTAAAAHHTIADLAKSLLLGQLVFVGDAFAFTASNVPDSWYSHADAACAFADCIRPGDLILIKASRSIRLEKVEAAIAARFA